jgi:hypothetical protein
MAEKNEGKQGSAICYSMWNNRNKVAKAAKRVIKKRGK